MGLLTDIDDFIKSIKSKKKFKTKIQETITVDRDGKFIMGIYDTNDIKIDSCSAFDYNKVDIMIEYLLDNYREDQHHLRINRNIINLVDNHGNVVLYGVTPLVVDTTLLDEKENELSIASKHKLKSKSGLIHEVHSFDGSPLCGTKANLSIVSHDAVSTCRNCLRLVGGELKEIKKKKLIGEGLPDGDMYYMIYSDDKPIRKSNKILKHYIYNNPKKAVEGLMYVLKNRSESNMHLRIFRPSERPELDENRLSIIYHENGIMDRDNRLIKYYYYVGTDRYGLAMVDTLNSSYNGLNVYLKYYVLSESISINEAGLNEEGKPI